MLQYKTPMVTLILFWALSLWINDSLCQESGLIDSTPFERASIGSPQLRKRADDERVGGSKRCQVHPYVKKPEYPKAQEVKQAEESAITPPIMVSFFEKAIYWKVPSDIPRDDSTEVPYVMRSRTNQLDAPENPMKLAVGGNQQYGTDVDHVYEAKLLDMYFYERLEARQITCGHIRAVFNNQQDPANPDLGTRLNALFSNLASYEHPEFVGMWGTWNQRKSKIWEINLTRRRAAPFAIPRDFDPETTRKGLTDFAMVLQILNEPTVHQLFQTTNARIYRALGDIDNIIHSQAAAGVPFIDDRTDEPVDVAPDWAASYRQWMNNKIMTQNAKLQVTATSAFNAIPTQNSAGVPSDAKWQASISVWSVYMKGFTVTYPLAHMTLPAVNDWPVLAGKGLGEGQAMTITGNGAVLSTATATVAKPTITSGPSSVP